MCSHDASQGYYNHRIRRVDLATGATTTLAGSGTQGFLNGAGGSAQFKHPSGIAIDPSGGFALVAVRASPAPPPIAPSRVSPPRTRCLGRTHSHRHATSRTGLALFAQTPPPPMHHRTGATTAFAAWSEEMLLRTARQPNERCAV